MTYNYEFISCSVCGKQFLVEQILIGINHTANIVITCKECINLSEKSVFEKEQPKAYKEIKEWIEEV